MIPVLLGTVTGTTATVAGIAVTGPATVRETAIAIDDILWWRVNIRPHHIEG